MSPEPERLDRFMARANAIYYASHDPFADFTTSPEVSQVFGEIIGLWAAVAWTLLGSPAPVAFVECGPGRGTLMADALRAIRRAAPAFAAALRLHLVETSPRLREAQAARLGQAAWHDDLSTVPDMPMILLANEFLDALPIRQFVRRGDGWRERFVAGNRWLEGAADADRVPMLPGVAEGAVIEINEPARAFAAAVAERCVRHPAAALLLDYGSAESRAGDSLQAIAGKRPADPLGAPGSADLTAHVDFAALAAVARASGGGIAGPVPQGRFLTALGLFQRIERLARGCSAEQAAALTTAAKRLADPAAMGQLFKVLAICSPFAPPLPGFAA